jgi:hypothetical protein
MMAFHRQQANGRKIVFTKYWYEDSLRDALGLDFGPFLPSSPCYFITLELINNQYYRAQHVKKDREMAATRQRRHHGGMQPPPFSVSG